MRMLLFVTALGLSAGCSRPADKDAPPPDAPPLQSADLGTRPNPSPAAETGKTGEKVEAPVPYGRDKPRIDPIQPLEREAGSAIKPAPVIKQPELAGPPAPVPGNAPVPAPAPKRQPEPPEPGAKRKPRPGPDRPIPPPPAAALPARGAAVPDAAAKVVPMADMRDLQIFIHDVSLVTGKMPTPGEIFAALLAARSPAAALVKDGAIILTGATDREGVWAYEARALSQGGLAVSQNGTQTLTAAELKAMLGM